MDNLLKLFLFIAGFIIIFAVAKYYNNDKIKAAFCGADKPAAPVEAVSIPIQPAPKAP